MSYLKKIEYEIVLNDSFLIIRGCPKCGRKFLLYLRKNIRGFLDNNEQLAEMYGTNMQLFRKNKADIDFDRLDYDFVKLHETLETNESESQILVTNHQFNWWFDFSPPKGYITARPKGRCRKHFYWSAIKRYC